MLWLAACARAPRRRRAGVRLARGRLAADARPRGPASGPPAGARRAPDRPSVGLPPRGSALARQPGERTGRRVGRRRSPDLVCVTGDLVSHPRGEARLRALLARLERPFVVLGNHDVAVTRDPFSRAAELRDLEQAQPVARRCARPSTPRASACPIVGVDPETYRAGAARPHDARRPATRACGSCSATSRASYAHCPPGRSTSSSPVISTRARSACPGRAGGSRWRIPRAPVRLGPLRDAGRHDARVAGNGHDLRPIQVLRAARRSTELVLRRRRLDWPAWRATPSSRTRCWPPTRRTRPVEVEGVQELVDGPRRHEGVRVTEEDGALGVELHVALEWGARAPTSATAVQRRVAEYLARTARLPSVDRRRRRRRRGRVRRLMPGGDLGPHPRDDPARRRPCAATASGGSRAATGLLQGAVDGARRGGLGRVGDDLPRRGRPPPGLAAVRSLAPLPACSRPPRRARHRRTPCSSRAPTSSGTAPSGSRSRCSSRRSASHATEARRRWRRSPTAIRRASRSRSASSSTARCFPRDFLDEFGFVTVRVAGPRRAVPARARRPRAGRGGTAREGAARRPGGVHAGARRPCRVPRVQRVAATPSRSSSAIWIALRAAPLRRLSLER